MKKQLFFVLCSLLLVPFMTSCWTLIYSEASMPEPMAQPMVYTTTVTTPSPKVTTVSTFVATSYNTDPCFYLDLNAVAAAFAESHSVKEFEQILNSSRYMINNLDLNHDGWIDYLRVIETRQGFYHAFLIQACLGPGMFQDVATLVAERQASTLYVEVIGDRYLYGANYIVRPVFVKRPPMWDVFGYSTYAVWSSPYYYGYYPSYYTRPKPVYLNHYQAYVNTYMTNHHYCHHCDYPSQPHYSGYTQMTSSHRRNDYQVAHPENSFERRVTNAAGNAGVTVRNAAQLRNEVEKVSARTSGTATTSAATTSTTRTSGRTGQASQPAQSSSTRTSGTTTSTKTTSTKTTSTTRQSTSIPSTTINTRVNKSGTTRTTVKTTDGTGRTQTVKREGTSSTRTSGSSSSATRSSQGTRSESSPRSGQRVR